MPTVSPGFLTLTWDFMILTHYDYLPVTGLRLRDLELAPPSSTPIQCSHPHFLGEALRLLRRGASQILVAAWGTAALSGVPHAFPAARPTPYACWRCFPGRQCDAF